VLLTTEYENAKQKLDYICPNGHKHKICWNDFRNGKRCPYCYGNIKYRIEFIKKQFEKEGYMLLSKEYKNNRHKLDYICPDGHSGSIVWGNWCRGSRCSMCAYINKYGPNHYNWKGGISCEPYCEEWLDKEYKESIKERDNYECQNIFCEGKYARLCVHHINYVKKNCQPLNLITLCESCNGKANFDREWHEAFYKEIMKRKLAVLKNSQ
jgi:hypothetical protein